MRKFWSLFQTQNFSFLHLPLPLHYLTQILSQPSGVSRTVGLRVADPSLQGPEALGVELELRSTTWWLFLSPSKGRADV